jgi:hypothetical protein
MKKSIFTLAFVFSFFLLHAGEIVKTFYFANPTVTAQGIYQTVNFPGTMITGRQGEPSLPYQAISLLLPPGEVAASMNLVFEGETVLPGSYMLFPKQEVLPLSSGGDGKFIMNKTVYAQSAAYPVHRDNPVNTQFLNGHSFALSTFTPMTYIPSSGKLSYFSKVTVHISTRPDARAENALKNITADPAANARILDFAQNKEEAEAYPEKMALKTGYQMLIITSSEFVTGFNDLVNYYNTQGIASQVVTTQSINSSMPGADLPEKMRNYIIQEYQNSGIEYVLLGGDVEFVPYRGFYCYVISGSGYEDSNIPADLYYSSLDGTWNDDGDSYWGEPGEDDLLPDVSVARFPFGNSTELANLVHKSVSYQSNPVTGELKQPFFVGEHLYSDPMTFGQDYLELLIDDHTDNGYFTHGIPSATNDITRLYDTLIAPPDVIYNWDVSTLLADINAGTSFIHHCGHSNVDYMMRLFSWDITDANFSQVNGVDHNYTLMYSHGCLCGAFDNDDCIAEKCVNIENFLVAGIFNSRYGWFDQGLTEGPSGHLHREFISALYNDTVANRVLQIGTAHMISKINTAPWCTMDAEFEPGAQRWCQYCCNVFGDPAMKVWTDEPNTGIGTVANNLNFGISPNPATASSKIQFDVAAPSDITISLINTLGITIQQNVLPGLSTGSHEFTLNVSGIASGVYIVKIAGPAISGSKKLIVNH